MKKPEQSVLERVLDNNATLDETKAALQWFKTAEGQVWLSQRMDQDANAIQLGSEEEWVDHKIPSDIMYEKIMKNIRQKRNFRILFRIAAILLPFVLVLGLFLKVNKQVDLFASAEEMEVVVPKGEKMRVIFQDGSSVLLNAGSKLSYPRKFGIESRNVKLSGEGLFDVAKNSSRPFFVNLDALDIKVLGTQFNVKAYNDDDHISVTLFNGLVELSSSFFESVNLQPGDNAVYNRKNKRCFIAHPENITEISSWKSNKFVFNQTPLKEVIKVLSRAYNVQFDIIDMECEKYSYTIHTTDQPLYKTLRELERIAPVIFIQKKNRIEVRLNK